MTPNTESMSTIRHTGEKTEFGPEELRFHLPIVLNEGDRAMYSVRATIRLYRFTKKAKDSQNVKERLRLPGSVVGIVKRDKYTYTFQDKKGKEFVLEDSMEVWKKEGKIYINSNLLPRFKFFQ